MKDFEISNYELYIKNQSRVLLLSIQITKEIAQLKLKCCFQVSKISIKDEELQFKILENNLIIDHQFSSDFILKIEFKGDSLDYAQLFAHDDKKADFHLKIASKNDVIASGDLQKYHAADHFIYSYSVKNVLPSSIIIKESNYSTLYQQRIEIFYPEKYQQFVSNANYAQQLEFIEEFTCSSYPFKILRIVFVDDISPPFISGAGIVLLNINLLLQPDSIQVLESRFMTCVAICSLWFGHYITPSKKSDLWLMIGFCRVVGMYYIKKVFGNNEFKFRILKDMERCCVIDCKQPALSTGSNDLLVGHPFDIQQDCSSLRAELINLKSCLVLLMMEKRFGGTKGGLLSKIAGKIMMTAMSGELSGGLGTLFFLKLARKTSGKLEIKEFADQWIFKSGCPLFTTSYNFNRKKMVSFSL